MLRGLELQSHLEKWALNQLTMAYDLISLAFVMGASQVALARFPGGKEHASHCSRPKR